LTGGEVLKINVYLAVVILLLAIGVLGSLYIAISQLLPTPAYPEYLWPLIDGVRYVFMTSAVAPVFVMVTNIFGYAINWTAASQAGKPIQYEGKKLLKTWLIYEGYMKGLTGFIMILLTHTSYEIYAVWIAGSIIFIAKIVSKTLSTIAGSNGNGA
jgi:hypothetical protein